MQYALILIILAPPFGPEADRMQQVKASLTLEQCWHELEKLGPPDGEEIPVCMEQPQ